MSDQLVFKDALKTKQKNDGWSEALSLQKENRKLKSQLEDVDNLLEEIENALDISLNITYKESRKVDVPVNYLDISRYEKYHGSLNPIPLREGILKTAEFMKEYYKI